MRGKRMRTHDYTRVGFYMITMVTHSRQRLFGECRDDRVYLTPAGEAVQRRWYGIPDLRPEIEASDLQVMPDHLHGILYVKQKLAKPLGNTIRGFASGVTSELRMMNNNDALKVWEPGFHDCITMGAGTLCRQQHYIRDNPRRYCLRKEHPDLFIRINQLNHTRLPSEEKWSGFGNLFLIEKPDLIPIQVSRRASRDEIATLRNHVADRLEMGAVAVSPFISPGEKEIAKMVMDQEQGSLILMRPDGFPELYKPSGTYFDFCAQGRLLVLTAFPHTGRRNSLSRQCCLQMNDWVERICRG